jgi:DNA-binding MarR family transcriptional regulator
MLYPTVALCQGVALISKSRLSSALRWLAMARARTIAVLELLVIHGGSMTSRGLRTHPETSGLSVIQYRLFVLVVTHDGLRVGELARLLGESPQQTSRLLRRLQDRGLVTTVRGVVDRREVNVWATELATSLWSDIGESRRSQIREALADLTIDDDTVSTLEILADRFARAVS